MAGQCHSDRPVGAPTSLLFIPLPSFLHLSATQLAWPEGN